MERAYPVKSTAYPGSDLQSSEKARMMKRTLATQEDTTLAAGKEQIHAAGLQHL